MSKPEESIVPKEEASYLASVFQELISNPINLGLILVIAFLIFKIFKSRTQVKETAYVPEPELPKLRRDFSVEELKQYDGTQPDGRVLVAVNGTVYDVTKGKRFYGPGKCFFFITTFGRVGLLIFFFLDLFRNFSRRLNFRTVILTRYLLLLTVTIYLLTQTPLNIKIF